MTEAHRVELSSFSRYDPLAFNQAVRMWKCVCGHLLQCSVMGIPLEREFREHVMEVSDAVEA